MVEALRLDGHLFAFQQSEHAVLAAFNARVLAVFTLCGIMRLVIQRLFIGADESLIIAQHDLVVGTAEEIVGHDRDLAAAPGRVHNKGWNRESAGMSAQSLQ